MLVGMFFWVPFFLGGGIHVTAEFQNNATLCDTVHTDYRQEGNLNKRILLRNPTQKRGRCGAARKMGEVEKDGVGREHKDTRRGGNRPREAIGRAADDSEEKPCLSKQMAAG